MELSQWRDHIAVVVRDEGQWLGVLDEDGLPLYELGGVVSVSFPEQRLSASSVEVVLAVAPGDRVMDDLVGEGLGMQDAEGRLVPAAGATRLLCLVREGERRVATVTHSVADGTGGPSTLTVHAIDLIDGLSWWPCPSIPLEWVNTSWSEWSTDAAGVPYEQPRTLAQVPFATKAFRYTMDGKAVTVVRDLVQDSFDAVNELYGWVDDPHAVVEYTDEPDTSKRVLVRVNDDPVMDTVGEACRSAGVDVEVRLWWPGDPAVRVRTARADGDSPARFEERVWPHPVQVVRVREMREVA